jgi:hypothetical protein
LRFGPALEVIAGEEGDPAFIVLCAVASSACAALKEKRKKADSSSMRVRDMVSLRRE